MGVHARVFNWLSRGVPAPIFRAEDSPAHPANYGARYFQQRENDFPDLPTSLGKTIKKLCSVRGCTTVAARCSPSPGTPGEGRGEGDLERKKSPDTRRRVYADTSDLRHSKSPSPQPSPGIPGEGAARRDGRAPSVRPHVAASLIFCLLSLYSVSVRGEITITFPLEGHYRPGRYMPVHVVGNTASGRISLQAEGSLPLTVPIPSGSVDITAPWLTVSSQLGNAVWTDNAAHPLATVFEPLTDNQRLVALAGIDAGEAREFFSDAEIVPVRLDVTNPLPGSPAAWDALDGLMLDENAAGRVTDKQLQTLLAAGTTVAIRSPRRPSGSWPWRRSGAFWVVAHTRIGPASLIEPAAYGPTYGWVRGLPWAVRRRALLSGLIVCSLLIGAALLPSRRGLLAIGGVAIITSLLWIAWQSRQQPLSTMTAQIVIQTGSLTQRDRWTWISSPVALETTFAAGALTHPVFFTHSQLLGTRMQLVCGDNNQPISFRFHLEPRLAIAFVSTTVDTEPDQHPLNVRQSTFSTMAEEVYVNPRLNVAGDYEDGDGSRTVVVRTDGGD
jgi:hypothetical protein